MLQSFAFSPPLSHQAVFRVLLDALTHPGEICRLPAALAADPIEMVKAVSQTLLDHEVTFALGGRTRDRISTQMIRHWTHARIAPAEEADFLIITGPEAQGDIALLQRGTPEMPDTGATAIFLLGRPMGRHTGHIPLTVSGPGIAPPGHRLLPAIPISDAEIDAIQEVNGEFPRGIDCFFLDPDGAMLGLPRSVALQRSV